MAINDRGRGHKVFGERGGGREEGGRFVYWFYFFIVSTINYTLSISFVDDESVM